MKKLKEIDLGYTGKRTWGPEPFVIAFVYPRNEKSILVKGDLDSVEKYIEDKYKNCFYSLNIYNRKTNWMTFRGNIDGHAMFVSKRDVNNGIDYTFENRKPTKDRFVLTVYNDETRREVFKKTFRKMPRCWIKELDQFIGE